MGTAFGLGHHMGPWMMRRGFEGPFGGHGILLGIGLIVVATIVVALIVWLANRKPATATATPGAVPYPVATPATTGAPTPAVDSALDIARNRLARGEIDVEQYKAIAEALGG